MSKLWEVDPETKAKLLEIQKQNGNNVCVDCGAPSPQWASPKFGVFMCLNCSGIHRGLGVHISFIRSVTMDGFKVGELKRMQLGGNKPWQEFFSEHKDNQIEGRTFEDSTVKDRYDSDVGEEWKERLTAKVEGKEYVPGTKSSSTTNRATGGSGSATASRSQTPIGRTLASESSPARSATPAAASKKAQNEAYFAKMGSENAARPDDLPPSQGGKYGGFGSQTASTSNSEGDWMEEIQKDTLAGITKGLGWLRTNAQSGYDGWVKPNVQKLAESDFTNQARIAAAQFGQNVQAGTKTAAESFNKFVEGDERRPPRGRSRSGTGSVQPDADKLDFWENFGNSPSGPDKDKQEFWDSFGSSPKGPDGDKRDFWDSFGSAPKGPEKDKKDFWDSFGSAPTGPSPDKKDFWDEFAAAADVTLSKKQGSTSIGTSAMRKTPGGATAGKDKGEDWGEW